MPTITTSHGSRQEDVWRPTARRPSSAASMRSQGAATPTSSYFSSAPSSPTKSIGLAGLNEAQAYQIDSTVPIRMRLDGVEVEWAPGREGWRLASEATTQVGGLKSENERLQAENNMLKFKLDVLLDMMASTKLDLVHSEALHSKLNAAISTSS